MDKAIGTLTVFFEEPFWVGVVERVSGGKLSVCKVVFGGAKGVRGIRLDLERL